MTLRNVITRILVAFIVVAVLGSAAMADTTSHLIGVQIKPLPNHRVNVRLMLDHPLDVSPKSFTTKNPARVIVDLPNTSKQLADTEMSKTVKQGALESYEIVEANQRLRMVLTLRQNVNFSVENHGKHVDISLAGGNWAEDPEHRQRVMNVSHDPMVHRITGIDFRGTPTHGGKVVVDLSDANIGVDIVTKLNDLTVDFYKTKLLSKLRRRLDVADFGAPVQFVDASQRGNMTQITLRGTAEYEHFAYQVDKQFIIEVNPLSETAQSALKKQKEVFQGKRISLNFQDIKVRSVLQLLTDFTKSNIVVSDTVTGNITLRLNNIPWDHALDIILKTRGLGQRKMGSVILIAPAQEITDRETRELQSIRQVQDLAPIHPELIQINYAKASEVAKLLKDKGASLLSERGNVSVDERTNTLWIQDTSKKLNEIQDLVRKLDIPVKQVLIEARIVIVDTSFERDLGVRFGITDPTHLSGTLEGANTIASGTPPTGFTNDTLAERLNVNLQATPSGTGLPTTIALALFNLGSNVLLDLELSALETEGQAEIVSSPRLITANQQSAEISSGEEIPYQEATSSGATSVSIKKAVLSLKVTPQITPDHNIVLNLQLNQDTPDFTRAILGVPPILTRQIQTNVLVSNGQTIVLGGIYQHNKSNDITRVPFLGRLPVVGALFRSNQRIASHEELLIFITPKIVEQSFATT